MSISIDVVPHDENVEAMNSSMDRLDRQHKAAVKEPSLFNDFMRGLALVAAAGTLLNVSLEVAESFHTKDE